MCYISNYNWQLYSNAPYTLGLVFLETLYSVILKRRRKYLALLTHLIFHGFPLSLILWCKIGYKSAVPYYISSSACLPLAQLPAHLFNLSGKERE